MGIPRRGVVGYTDVSNKDFADPLNKHIDDLTAQHHGLSQRVAQLESCQHVIVDEARRGQDRGETLRTEVHHLKSEVALMAQSCRSYTLVTDYTRGRFDDEEFGNVRFTARHGRIFDAHGERRPINFCRRCATAAYTWENMSM